MKHITQISATSKIVAMLNSGVITKTELSEILDMGRPTLDRRLIKHNWKKGELEIIKNLR